MLSPFNVQDQLNFSINSSLSILFYYEALSINNHMVHVMAAVFEKKDKKTEGSKNNFEQTC